MKITFRTLTLAAALSLSLSSCAKNLNNNAYTENSTVGIVYEGTVLSARQVIINANDKLGDKPGLGTLAGGLGGGIAGSEVGKGKGSAAGAVGGAVAGAVIGAIIDQQLNKQQGMEYIVKLSDDSLSDAVEGNNKTIKLGGDSVSDKIRSSTKLGMKSKIISVVQGLDQVVQPGQKVYVIYNDDRPRVVPAF